MTLEELSGVATAALPLAGFKDHLRLGSGFADDGVQDEVLEAVLRAALAAIEARTGKVLLEREFRWSVTAWRDRDRQPLPLAPVSAVVAVRQVDRNGTQIPVTPTRTVLIPDAQRPVLSAPSGGLPAVPRDGRVEVDLLAGYGPEWSDLPADLAQAVMMLAAHFHEYRSNVGVPGAALPFGVTSLIERYRTVRMFMGGRS
ncbi:phage conserved hypothetical protein, phiE125 gp8 family [Loktanella fryxellensis]|uniref:Phage gp6-like head-tail connector protein n=1 Tax=Loktanella fryxellensis TaxID=245187 RepID=A0A1H7YDN2_9RHOB|nr:hypothetical protein [Loktanella fryxellensis]SEM44001.1 phage conserved hypothetical protein, phiE125 gp8 family [Loktanella fryxellensis]